MFSRVKPLISLQSSFYSEGVRRFFSKIIRFKERFPELYEHVHPDSKYLFDNPWVGSSQKVKWICDKGPDHVWESELGTRIKAYHNSKKCNCVWMQFLHSCLPLLYWPQSISNQFISFKVSGNCKGMVL